MLPRKDMACLLFRYVRQHRRSKLDQPPNYRYLGHPINAYHFIRHVLYGWQYVSHHLSAMIQSNRSSSNLRKIFYSQVIETGSGKLFSLIFVDKS